MADLKTYKVIALSVGGRGKKIFSSGDIVTENDFAPGVADQLVYQNYLEVSEETTEGHANEFLPEERVVEYNREEEKDEAEKTETKPITGSKKGSDKKGKNKK